MQLFPAALACPGCGTLVHTDRLQQLARQATSLERSNPEAAIATWAQCLALLPQDAGQHRTIAARIDALRQGAPPAAPSEPDDDPMPVALAKTGISMAITIWFLWLISGGDWIFAAGSTLLILVHELGHVIANRWYGLKASPPIFLGPFGAIINLRTPPPNAWVEAIVGIAGPVLGSIGAIAVYIYARLYDDSRTLQLAEFGFFINLINLLPVPPLDGGRVAAALSPRLWVVGLVGLGGLLVYRATHGGLSTPTIFIVVWLLTSAVPRISMTLKHLPLMRHYYDVPANRRIAMAVLYVGLGIALYWLRYASNMGMRM